jgi:SIT4-associating protein SAP185/190
MDEDTVMTEFGEESIDNYDDDGPTELERELAKAERPAPLFARKEAPVSDDLDPVHGARSPDEIEEVEQSVATLQGDSSTLPNGERPPFDTESDGSPVVGDLLKIRFVEHHVVPTILVSSNR